MYVSKKFKLKLPSKTICVINKRLVLLACNYAFNSVSLIPRNQPNSTLCEQLKKVTGENYTL